ncbi:hypothetical protein H6P81_006682 [Aristolochia fimbriata]|uniref:Protein FAR1-RELATED SEQUENCE n=1 Tax=Aristolochia fimbriata TaxID=158543 RepID=A0AAV7EYC3_ARIFI|nr:hypothetical protein H6P81_006682 [Aristolochia fimbriata]
MSEGIPCRHILAVLRNEYVDHLSEAYIMKKWTEDVWKTVTFDNNGCELREDVSKIKPYNECELQLL